MEPTPPPSLETCDSALVLEAAAGGLQAFEALVDRYRQAVFNIALWKSKNYFDAEDLTQDIFLAAFRALATLKTPERFSSWLFGIAYNRCHKWFRRERTKIVKFAEIRERAAREERRRYRASLKPIAPHGAGGASGGDDEHVSDLLGRLPPEIREVLVLKYLEGLNYEEIEARLCINPHRIDYLLRKGKRLLRARLDGSRLEQEGT